MGYRGIVKGNVVLLAEGVTLPEGTEVEVTPVGEPLPGSPAALLHVWGSDIPDEAWDALEKVIEELDSADREYDVTDSQLSPLHLRQHGLRLG
jgi:hypothetical protein